MTNVEIGWLAGILEGEGNFRILQTPSIRITMADLDIIEKFRALTKTTDSKIGVRPRDAHKTTYCTGIYGNLAIQWMMTLYPLMGVRRREKIKDIIEKWREGEYTKEQSRIHNAKYKENIASATERYKRRQAIKSIMFSRKVSMEEAEKLFEDLVNKTVN